MSDFDPAETIVSVDELAHALDETTAQIYALTPGGKAAYDKCSRRCPLGRASASGSDLSSLLASQGDTDRIAGDSVGQKLEALSRDNAHRFQKTIAKANGLSAAADLIEESLEVTATAAKV
jgi:hypothetical protein